MRKTGQFRWHGTDALGAGRSARVPGGSLAWTAERSERKDRTRLPEDAVARISHRGASILRYPAEHLACLENVHVSAATAR